MKPVQWLVTRLLDPAGGDDINHPHRRLRLNFRRIEMVAVFGMLIAVVEAVFSFQRGIEGYLEACIGLGFGCVGFLLVAHHAQRRPAERFRHLPEAFVLFALLASQTLCYFIAMAGRIASGYSLVYLACAVFFLISPRRFALIGVVTFAIFLTWVLASNLDPFEQVNTLFNAALAVAFGMMGRWGLDRLEQVNEEQKRKIAEQNAALLAMNERLQRNNDELNGLMAVAAHDLRSPLFGLGNLLDLASARPPQTPEGWQDVLKAAGTSIGSMQTLISRILEAHEAEISSVMALEVVDLHAALRSAIVRNKATADRHAIGLELDAGTHPVQAMAQPHALEQVLDNLISNAIRFSPRGSQIHLLAGEGARPCIVVLDRGIGIAEGERASLFGKFKRGAGRPLNGQWGSGLGLYIVRTITTAMQADIVYLPRDGGGSVFRLEFMAVD